MKSIIVIGAGIAGLSAGIYARKNGFDVTIYESHYLAGGMCTGWKRKGYYFEGCFHYIKLLGISKSSMFYDIWKQLGALNNIKMISQDYIQAFRDNTGKTLHIYTDPDRFQNELIKISKDDEKKIKELCRTIKRCYWFTHTKGINPIQFIRKILNIVFAMPFLFKYGKMSLNEYSLHFKDTLIRQAITKIFDYNNISCIQLPMFLGLYYGENVNFPEGGSLALIKAVEKTFLDLGGKIKYKTTVKKSLQKTTVLSEYNLRMNLYTNQIS